MARRIKSSTRNISGKMLHKIKASYTIRDSPQHSRRPALFTAQGVGQRRAANCRELTDWEAFGVSKAYVPQNGIREAWEPPEHDNFEKQACLIHYFRNLPKENRSFNQSTFLFLLLHFYHSLWGN